MGAEGGKWVKCAMVATSKGPVGALPQIGPAAADGLPAGSVDVDRPDSRQVRIGAARGRCHWPCAMLPGRSPVGPAREPETEHRRDRLQSMPDAKRRVRRSCHCAIAGRGWPDRPRRPDLGIEAAHRRNLRNRPDAKQNPGRKWPGWRWAAPARCWRWKSRWKWQEERSGRVRPMTSESYYLLVTREPCGH